MNPASPVTAAARRTAHGSGRDVWQDIKNDTNRLLGVNLGNMMIGGDKDDLNKNMISRKSLQVLKAIVGIAGKDKVFSAFMQKALISNKESLFDYFKAILKDHGNIRYFNNLNKPGGPYEPGELGKSNISLVRNLLYTSMNGNLPIVKPTAPKP